MLLVAVLLISNNAIFKTGNITKDKKKHLIMMMGSIHHDINVYMHGPNEKALQYIKQKYIEIKGEKKQIHI